jgi:hypothetical protein
MKSINKSLLIASCVLFSSVSLAGTTTWEWNLDSSVGPNEVLGNNNGDAILSVDGTNTNNANTLGADVSAFADTGGPNDDVIQSGNYHFYNNNSWGVVNQDESLSDNPGHAFDNLDGGTVGGGCPSGYRASGQRPGQCYSFSGGLHYVNELPSYDDTDYDMALISFDTSVELTDIEFGWRSDGDFTLLAYNGAGTPSIAGSTWAAEANSGDWLTVGQYNGGVTGSYYAVNDTGISSQFWLLGAYNSVFGVGTGGVDANDDAFKVRKLKGNTTDSEEVSAPSAFALLLMGLGGLYLRRNKKA